MITRIDPPIPLKTPKGKALAYFMVDYGIDHDLMWICFQNETGECWTWKNKDIRADDNITIGRLNVNIPNYKMEEFFINGQFIHRDKSE
jgi:hypothetical protein